MRVKICGITRPEDARAAEQSGADAIGFIFVRHSKRFVSLEQARAASEAVGPFIERVGVFTGEALDEIRTTARALRLNAVQLHDCGNPDVAAALRSEFRLIKAVSFTAGLDPDTLRGFPADAFHLDGLRPGGGERFDWAQAQAFRSLPHLVLAGGLDAGNVAAGIEALAPYAVDVSSGVERAPGIKDHGKIQDFVRVAKFTRLSTVIHRAVDNCG